MAFSTYHGDIDITFPESVSFTASLSSDKGKVLADFATTLKEVTPIQHNPKKITLRGLAKHLVNGGGPDLLIKSVGGNIYLRKNQ